MLRHILHTPVGSEDRTRMPGGIGLDRHRVFGHSGVLWNRDGGGIVKLLPHMLAHAKRLGVAVNDRDVVSFADAVVANAKPFADPCPTCPLEGCTVRHLSTCTRRRALAGDKAYPLPDACPSRRGPIPMPEPPSSDRTGDKDNGDRKP
jgi:hypothetical protein